MDRTLQISAKEDLESAEGQGPEKKKTDGEVYIYLLYALTCMDSRSIARVN